MATGNERRELGPGEVIKHGPGDTHAWKALEDSDCLVFTRGPRSGEDYESDTYRLDEPLLT
jgi:quercetin dioxygenase-like cupin family protein